MTKLLEIKDAIVRVYAKGETYFNMGLKFILALIAFLTINNSIGYMSKISSIPVAIVLALICCLLPASATLWVAAVLILVNLYALAVEAAIVGFLLLAIIYFLYFRFCPKDNVIALLTPIAFRWNVPNVMVMPAGLLRPAYSALSVCCGTVVYYFLDGVRQNASSLTSITADDTSSTDRLSVLAGIILSNKEMYVALIALALTTLFIYFIRRLKVDYSWIIAIIGGALLQLIIIIVGSLIASTPMHIVRLLVGTVLAIVLGLILQFFAMNLDYERVENVQYEDDDYYYYVKAVPKKYVAAKEKTVKQFGSTGKMPRVTQKISGDTTVISSKDIAKEMGIDEKLLK